MTTLDEVVTYSGMVTGVFMLCHDERDLTSSYPAKFPQSLPLSESAQCAVSVAQSALSVAQSALSVAQSALSVAQPAVAAAQPAVAAAQPAVALAQAAVALAQPALSLQCSAPQWPRCRT